MKYLFLNKHYYLVSFFFMLFLHHTDECAGTAKDDKGVLDKNDHCEKSASCKKEKERWEDPSPTRIITSRTAFVQKKGTVDVNTFTYVLYYSPAVLNIQEASVGISKNFDITASLLIPPVFYAGLGLYPKFGIQLAKFISVGLILDLAFAIPYNRVGIEEYRYIGCTLNWDMNMCKPWFFYGGTPVITIGNNDFNASLSVTTLGFSGPADECILSTEKDTCFEKYIQQHIIVLPSLGASIRILKWLKINIEIFGMYKHNVTHPAEYTYVKAAIFPAVGIKIFGKRFYGGANIQVPLLFSDSGWKASYFYIHPSFSFGFIVP